MSFSRLNDLVQRKAGVHPTLRSLREIALLKKAWESGGSSVLALSKQARQHLMRSVRVAAFIKKIVVLSVEDASTAAALVAQKQSLLVFFRRHCPEFEIEDISIRHARSVTHRP